MQEHAVNPTSTKEQILQAACRLIHRQGFNNTSLEEILRESGVGKGNFYYYFKSKDDLGYAILDRLALWTSQQIGQGIFRRAEDPVAAIFQLFDFLLAMQREAGCVGGCPLGNLAVEMSDIHDGFRRRIGEIIDSFRGHITDALARAQARGRLARNVQLDSVAEFIFAGIEGAILLAKVRKDPTLLEGCFGELKKYVGTYLVQ
jgi:TetR/AcrR family transcriptional repressor of nem operon